MRTWCEWWGVAVEAVQYFEHEMKTWPERSPRTTSAKAWTIRASTGEKIITHIEPQENGEQGATIRQDKVQRGIYAVQLEKAIE
jgi:hypothetical protein